MTTTVCISDLNWLTRCLRFYFPNFLLSCSFDWEDISSTQDNVWHTSKLNTSKFVKNTPLHVVFLTLFSVFGNVVKHHLSCMIYMCSTCYISNFCVFFAELRQRNVLPKVESPGAPLQQTISEPTLAESPSQSKQSGDSNKVNQQATEPRKSNSLMNISASSAGKTCACLCQSHVAWQSLSSLL